MAHYRVTYKMNAPSEFGDTLFVMRKEISRYTPAAPHEWLKENLTEWEGRTIISVESMD
ncbi:MAG TPA: hypothetical protein VFG07_03605 [Thermoplasmata archaeon]|nr:hypothetical protein [Thermoplasmata archaeon]